MRIKPETPKQVERERIRVKKVLRDLIMNQNMYENTCKKVDACTTITQVGNVLKSINKM